MKVKSRAAKERKSKSSDDESRTLLGYLIILQCITMNEHVNRIKERQEM